MASEQQIAANRRNAKLSTGPTTADGKTASSRNAITHGLTASRGLLPGESAEEYEQMLEALIAELMPESALERELVERIVSILWRLRRVPAFEAALMAWLRKCEEEDAEHDAIYAVGRGDNRNQLMLGRTIQTFLKSDFSGKLGRHETALQRQLSAFIIELREIQARRKHASESQDALPAPK